MVGTLILVALDQATKLYAVHNISALEPIVIFENFFELTHVMNPGGAFGILASNSSSFRHPFFLTIVPVSIVIILYTYFTLKEDYKMLKVALCFILSGAIGNFIDRLRLKAVIDFISVHYHDLYWPAFNIADALITIGVFIVLVDLFIIERKREEAKQCAQ